MEKLEAFTKLAKTATELEKLWDEEKEEEAKKKELELKKLRSALVEKGFLDPIRSLDKEMLEELNSIPMEILEGCTENLNFFLDLEAFAFSIADEIDTESFSKFLNFNREIIKVGIKRKCWSLVKRGYIASIEISMLAKNFESAYKFGEELLTLYEKMGDLEIVSLALKYMVSAAINMGRHGKAIELLHKKIEIDKTVRLEEELSEDYVMLGDLYLESGNIVKCEKALMAGAQYCQSTSQISDLLHISIIDTKIAAKKGNLEESIRKARRLAEIWEEHKRMELKPDLFLLSEIYIHIADVHLKMGEQEKAIEVLKEGYEKLNKEDTGEAADICRKIASIYNKRNEIAKMEEWIKRAEELESADNREEEFAEE